MAVREAERDDWAAIWPFFKMIVRAGESFGYDTDMAESDAHAMWLDGPPTRTTVATDEAGQVLGSANTHRNRGGPGAHIASATFLVDPRHQGRGAGRALVEDSLAWARESGFRAMQFNAVVATNTPAVSLYESLGFEIVGTIPEGFNHPRHGYVALHIHAPRTLSGPNALYVAMSACGAGTACPAAQRSDPHLADGAAGLPPRARRFVTGPL